MSTKSKVATINDVKAGKTLYKVYALGKQSFIETVYVLSKPFMHKTINSLFAKERFYFTVGNYPAIVNTFSLSDSGIIPNSYNGHKTFTTLKAAQRYLEGIDKTQDNNHAWYDDYVYEDRNEYLYDEVND